MHSYLCSFLYFNIINSTQLKNIFINIIFKNALERIQSHVCKILKQIACLVQDWSLEFVPK